MPPQKAERDEPKKWLNRLSLDRSPYKDLMEDTQLFHGQSALELE